MDKKPIGDLCLRKAERLVDMFPWGRLEWYASGNINGGDITLGYCYLNPKMENATHFHLNCDEVLCVVDGSIIHRLGGEEIAMNEGDALFIPQGVVHNARNAGNKEAVLSIAFTTGDRKTANE